MGIICPVCHRTLSKAESLHMMEDTQGKVVVWHLIPAEIPSEGLDDADMSEYPPAYPQADLRTWCGSAGFTVSIN